MIEAICVWGFSIAVPLKVVCDVLGVITMIVGVVMTDDSSVKPKTCLITVLSGAAVLALGLLFPTEGAWETWLEMARRP